MVHVGSETVRPALAGGTTDEIDRFPVWVERKYDGIRLMLHKATDARGSVLAAAYTRAGGSIRKEIFPGEPHAFISAKPTAPNTLRALEIIKTFVHEHAG